jgi:hypothetical protein
VYSFQELSGHFYYLYLSVSQLSFKKAVLLPEVLSNLQRSKCLLISKLDI